MDAIDSSAARVLPEVFASGIHLYLVTWSLDISEWYFTTCTSRYGWIFHGNLYHPLAQLVQTVKVAKLVYWVTPQLVPKFPTVAQWLVEVNLEN